MTIRKLLNLASFAMAIGSGGPFFPQVLAQSPGGLSPEVEVDILNRQLMKQITAEKYTDALQTAAKIRQHTTSPPETLTFLEGTIYQKMNYPVQALASMEAYVKSAGTEGKYYSQAIDAIADLRPAAQAVIAKKRAAAARKPYQAQLTAIIKYIDSETGSETKNESYNYEFDEDENGRWVFEEVRVTGSPYINGSPTETKKKAVFDPSKTKFDVVYPPNSSRVNIRFENPIVTETVNGRRTSTKEYLISMRMYEPRQAKYLADQLNELKQKRLELDGK